MADYLLFDVLGIDCQSLLHYSSLANKFKENKTDISIFSSVEELE